MVVNLLSGKCEGSVITVWQKGVLPPEYNQYDLIPESTFSNYVVDAYGDRKLASHIDLQRVANHIWRLTSVNVLDIEMPEPDNDNMYLCCAWRESERDWVYTVHFKEFEMSDDIDGWEVENRLDG